MREAVNAATGAGSAASEPLVLGILSLIIWALLIVVTAKYVLFLLRAERILESVGELSAQDRELAMDALRQKVPPLSREEVLWAFTENLRWYRRWWEQHNEGPSDEELLRIVQLARGRIGPV